MLSSSTFQRLMRRKAFVCARIFLVTSVMSVKEAEVVILWATHTRENFDRENEGYLKLWRKNSLFCLDAVMLEFGLEFVLMLVEENRFSISRMIFRCISGAGNACEFVLNSILMEYVLVEARVLLL